MNLISARFRKECAFYIGVITLLVLIPNICFSGQEGTTFEMQSQKGASLVSTGIGNSADGAMIWSPIMGKAVNFGSVASVTTTNVESVGGFIGSSDRKRPDVVLEGNWQSCLEADGSYTEREWSYRFRGEFILTLHLGPRDEFALYAGGPVDDHIAHEDARNLLGPKFRIGDITTARGKRAWAKLGFWISIVQAGGGRSECESFYVLVVKGAK